MPTSGLYVSSNGDVADNFSSEEERRPRLSSRSNSRRTVTSRRCFVISSRMPLSQPDPPPLLTRTWTMVGESSRLIGIDLLAEDAADILDRIEDAENKRAVIRRLSVRQIHECLRQSGENVERARYSAIAELEKELTVRQLLCPIPSALTHRDRSSTPRATCVASAS